jgi:hypothetical protein
MPSRTCRGSKRANVSQRPGMASKGLVDVHLVSDLAHAEAGLPSQLTHDDDGHVIASAVERSRNRGLQIDLAEALPHPLQAGCVDADRDHARSSWSPRRAGHRSIGHEYDERD